MHKISSVAGECLADICIFIVAFIISSGSCAGKVTNCGKPAAEPKVTLESVKISN